jgi:DNA repair photolyase
VERDLDLLNDIGKNTWCTVSVTITTSDKEKAAFLEPHVVSPERRFTILKNIKSRSRNIQTGVLLMPVIPFLCDDEYNLREMVRKAKEAGADYILFGGGMTMRDMQALWFLKHVKEQYPEYITNYEEEYHFEYNPEKYTGSYVTSQKYYKKINQLLLESCERYGISYRIKRYIPDDYRKFNYLIAERMLNQAYRVQMMGNESKSLFWTGMNIQILKESVVEMNKRNELGRIKGINKELKEYIEKYIKKYYRTGR